MSQYKREISIALAYLVLLGVLAVFAPRFYQGDKFLNILVASAPVLVAAVGMTLVILSRNIDISIGSQLSICGVVAGLLAKTGLPMPLVALSTMAVGASMGALNGVFVAMLGLPSIVVTLATMVIFREALRWWREGESVKNLPPDFQWFGLGQSSRAVGDHRHRLVHVCCFRLGTAVCVRGASRVCHGFRSGCRLVGWCAAPPCRLLGLDADGCTDRAGCTTQRGAFRPSRSAGRHGAGAASDCRGRGRRRGNFRRTRHAGWCALRRGAVGHDWIGLGVSRGGGVLGKGAARRNHSDCRGLRRIRTSSGEPMPVELSPTSEAATLRRFQVTHELVLAAVLAVEIVVFSAIGTNFLTWANAFEISRLFVEVGLLAVAMTPVIVTGGIDLSVGSLMGLSAVLFGELYRDFGWPIPAAAIGHAC